MKYIIFPVLLFAVFMNSFSNVAADEPETAREIIANSLVLGNTRFAINNSFAMQSSNKLSTEKMVLSETPAPGSKSVAKAVLLSAAIPGAGQFYTKSYIKGIVFLVIEAASLTGYFHYQNRGNDLEAGFEDYADQYWDEDVYWSWVNDECQKDPTFSGSCSSNPILDREQLREYERERSDFTHSLPGEINQQYYENIGKYDQFNIGWEDAVRGNVAESELREDYTVMRKVANDNFQRATNLITVVLFNHVVSALDASFTTRRFNRRVVQTRLRFKSMLYDTHIVPALTLGVIW